METTREFEMLYKGNLETFEVRFEYEAWEDCFDISDPFSNFVDWEHSLLDVSYTTEDGEHIVLSNSEYNALLPEQKGLIEYNIEAQIQNEVL